MSPEYTTSSLRALLRIARPFGLDYSGTQSSDCWACCRKALSPAGAVAAMLISSGVPTLLIGIATSYIVGGDTDKATAFVSTEAISLFALFLSAFGATDSVPPADAKKTNFFKCGHCSVGCCDIQPLSVLSLCCLLLGIGASCVAVFQPAGALSAGAIGTLRACISLCRWLLLNLLLSRILMFTRDVQATLKEIKEALGKSSGHLADLSHLKAGAKVAKIHIDAIKHASLSVARAERHAGSNTSQSQSSGPAAVAP